MTDEMIEALRHDDGISSGAFDEAERAALRFGDRLTLSPGEVGDEDREALERHFTAEQIVHLVLVVANVNLSNRISQGLKFPVDL